MSLHQNVYETYFITKPDRDETIARIWEFKNIIESCDPNKVQLEISNSNVMLRPVLPNAKVRKLETKDKNQFEIKYIAKGFKIDS